MPFDTQTRNRLARFVTDARELITSEFSQQLQSIYGISNSGEIAPLAELTHFDEEQRALAEVLRDRVEYLKASSVQEKDPAAAAVDRLTREQAFTVLNRLAALRMAENRGFILQSVGRGYQSKGFQVYSQVAGGGLGDTYHRYRRYLFCLFDELAVDLGALFDRRSPAGLLFPRETVLLALFQLINAPEIDSLWAEDETIGWIYQYYNDEAERKRMREQSATPRDGRELAVRNQFFTPRYVVEFLVDNTLGRIWYEARKGQTALKDICRYLIRRPSECFLAEGESTSSSGVAGDNPLERPAYIPHRPKKDPRDLKILDPACGSGHFLLYSFDLLEVIYEEAWSDERDVPSELTNKSIREDFPDLYELRKAVPELIVRHNLHGIDIDLRACQIAALALWLRVQRTYQRQNLKPTERPRIIRSNIVCAERMPGDRTLLEQFVADLQPKALGQLVQVVFEKMKLAGEAGSLLKLEDEIAGTVAEAKKLWLAGPRAEQERLFAEDTRPEQTQLGFDTSGITDEAFWDKAEEQIYAELRTYAEGAESRHEYQRRLFAGDAARGFAFVDLCRKLYDIVLMNPPFGEFSGRSRVYIRDSYIFSSNDILAAFVDRFVRRLTSRGRLGAITSRTCLFLLSFKPWREEVILGATSPVAVVDLGHGVMDAAMVEAAAYVLEKRSDETLSACFRLLSDKDKEGALRRSLAAVQSGATLASTFWVVPSQFGKVPGSPFCYWVGDHVRELFVRLPPFDSHGREAKQGLATGDDFRFVRAWWEVSASALVSLPGGSPPHVFRSATRGHVSWCPFAKGGAFSPFYQDLCLVVRWTDDGYEIRNFTDPQSGTILSRYRGAERYFEPGFTYADRASSRFAARVLPEGAVISVKGSGIYCADDLWSSLAVLNSRIFGRLMDLLLGTVGLAKSYQVNTVGRVPWPSLSEDDKNQLRLLGQEAWRLGHLRDRADLTSHAFVKPAIDKECDSLAKAQSLWATSLSKQSKRLSEIDQQIDDITVRGYGLSSMEYDAIENASVSRGVDPEVEDQDQAEMTNGCGNVAADLIDYCYGASLGRWDARFAMGDREFLGLPDPFAPLPVCPPGMLQNEHGLPLDEDDVRRLGAAGTSDYPIDLPWSGILVDDPENANDIVDHVQEVLKLIWKERSEDVELEACEILQVRDLREYFRKPSFFFADHLKRYSKSRRQAPIYWPLSTSSGRYTLWLYYPRLTSQTLHRCVADFISPKLKSISAEIQMLRNANGSQSRMGDLLELRDELNDMYTEIERIIKLPYIPNPNDGAVITACPLSKLFRLSKWQKDLKNCWEELQRGNYDWAHLALSIWPDRVKQKCKDDRSIAIAHNLEHLCELEQLKPKAKKGRAKQASFVNEDAK